MEALFDVMTDTTIEQVVFVTNDTDIVPALRKIKEYNEISSRSPVRIGLIVPIRKNERRPNKSLTAEADWTIHYINEHELDKAQLPCRLLGRKVAIKPIDWFKFPSKVAEIIAVLSEVEGSVPKAWKWLSKPLYPAEGLPTSDNTPIDVMDDESELAVILEHAKAYAQNKNSKE